MGPRGGAGRRGGFETRADASMRGEAGKRLGEAAITARQPRGT